jgi:ribonuclease J
MLRKEIPIVTSPESIVIMKCMQDTGVSSLETDIAYFSPRQQTDDLGLYLSSIADIATRVETSTVQKSHLRA